jgi:hypothetical protein
VDENGTHLTRQKQRSFSETVRPSAAKYRGRLSDIAHKVDEIRALAIANLICSSRTAKSDRPAIGQRKHAERTVRSQTLTYRHADRNVVERNSREPSSLLFRESPSVDAESDPPLARGSRVPAVLNGLANE